MSTLEKSLEKSFASLMGEALDEHYEQVVSYMDTDALKEAYDNMDRFWDGEDHDPLYSDGCSPYHGNGLAWDAADQAVSELTDEQLVAEQVELGSYRDELKEWPYVDNQTQRLNLDDLDDDEKLDIERWILTASLIQGNIEQYHTPNTKYDVEEAIKAKLVELGEIENDD